MQIIYFSPHFDDVAFSCGGLIWQQVQEGQEVSIWTLFSGDPPEKNLTQFARDLHARWKRGKYGPPNRREEDISACEILGVPYLHLDLLDCVYRINSQTSEPLYPSEEAIFAQIHDDEIEIRERWTKKISKLVPKDAVLVSPLCIGNHVDHQITRKILEKLSNPIQYYLDFPYADKNITGIDQLIPEGGAQKIFPIGNEGLKKWQQSIEAYQSQISSFWTNNEEMRGEIANFSEKMGGGRIIMTK